MQTDGDQTDTPNDQPLDAEKKSDAEPDWLFDYEPIKSWADYMEQTEETIDDAAEIEAWKIDFPVNEDKTDQQEFLQSLWGSGGEACSAAELNRLCAGQREMDSCVALILLSVIITLSTADVVQLADGGRRCAGRVDIFRRDGKGTVCDGYWDMKAAAVVCRELGCGEAVDVLSDAHFGPGLGQMWNYMRICNGSESTISKCKGRNMESELICHRTKSAGMICSEVRLVGGSRCSGRVEVLHRETWSTVCDADFDQQDAEVVCRELGCGLPVEVLGAAAFGRGEGQVWSEELQCRGNESQIYFCPTTSLKHNCSHDSDVGLVCAGKS
ncbi:hypothetical protein MHYP_G00319160 [Metynnis hypsauchen]